MRDSNNAFHLAIPCKDLDETVVFYENKLGCELRRRYDDRVTFFFFGDQLVCHLSRKDAIEGYNRKYANDLKLKGGQK